MRHHRFAPLLRTPSLFFVGLLVPHAESAIAPLSPGPGDAYREGGTCSITWNTDQTGTWKNMTIELMSGPNLNQSVVLPVAHTIDGTSLSTHNWICPHVSPHSNIYFYRFHNGMDMDNAAWTARFTIESPSGAMMPPEYNQQPDGAHIPWGYGHVVEHPASAKALSKSGLDSTPTHAQVPEQTESRGLVRDRRANVSSEGERGGQGTEKTIAGPNAGESAVPRRGWTTLRPVATVASRGERHNVVPSLHLICALCILWALL